MILTIRTDKPESEIGLFDDNKKLAYQTWQAHRKLAETIHKKLKELLDGQGKTLQELTGIVVYQGPGSFTGLRIGMSVANALAYGLEVPITSVGGERWAETGIESLANGQAEKVALPEYGAPVRVTAPKK